jgi:hypothetical protein
MAHSGYSDIDFPSHTWRRPAPKEMHMKKTVTAALAAATIAVSLTASVNDAAAGRRGGAVAAGVAAGLVGGLIVGSAIANSGPAYAVAPAPGFVAYPGYYAALPGPRCYWTRMPVYDRFGNVRGWRGRPVAVCP